MASVSPYPDASLYFLELHEDPGDPITMFGIFRADGASTASGDRSGTAASAHFLTWQVHDRPQGFTEYLKETLLPAIGRATKPEQLARQGRRSSNFFSRMYLPAKHFGNSHTGASCPWKRHVVRPAINFRPCGHDRRVHPPDNPIGFDGQHAR